MKETPKKKGKKKRDAPNDKKTPEKESSGTGESTDPSKTSEKTPSRQPQPQGPAIAGLADPSGSSMQVELGQSPSRANASQAADQPCEYHTTFGYRCATTMGEFGDPEGMMCNTVPCTSCGKVRVHHACFGKYFGPLSEDNPSARLCSRCATSRVEP